MGPPLQRKTKVIGALAFLVLLGSGIAVLFAVRKNAAKPVVQPTAATPVAGAAVAEVVLAGRIQSRASSKVPAPVDGVIRAFHAEVGAEVYEGQLLADIQNAEVEGSQELANLELERIQQRVNTTEGTLAAARLEASRANADAARVKSELDRATRNYQRQKLLLSEGATPRRTFEKAEAEFQSLETEAGQLSELARQADDRVQTLQRDVDAARKLLDGTTSDLEAVKGRLVAGQVLSPANGIISARRGQVGDHVNPTVEDLFVIATDLSQLEVVLEPDPVVLARIKQGQQAGIVLADVPNETLPGTVKRVENGRVTVEFANPSPLVKPGMTASVRIRLG